MREPNVNNNFTLSCCNDDLLSQFTFALETLNVEQRTAVESTIPQVVIYAGPGTGKTKTISMRIGHLILQKGIPPSQICAVTYSRKAAKEMKERVAMICGPLGRKCKIGTFHSICGNMLKQRGSVLGIQENYSILDENQKKTLLADIVTELDMEDCTSVGFLSMVISKAKNDMEDPDKFLESAKAKRDKTSEQIVAPVYKKYEEKLKERNSLDYDDLLMKCKLIFDRYPDIRNYFSQRFTYVLVDEFQDTNALQFNIAKDLAYVHQNIFVVGDPDQTIYSWRNANPKNLDIFLSDFPQAQRIFLKINYRSTQKILRTAAILMNEGTSSSSDGGGTNNARQASAAILASDTGSKTAPSRDLVSSYGEGEPIIAKENKDPEAEADFIAKEITRLMKDNIADQRCASKPNSNNKDGTDSNAQRQRRSYKDFAVLLRTNNMSRSLEEAFDKYDIPYTMLGTEAFYDRQEIKDIIAFLQLLNDPTNREAFDKAVSIKERELSDKAREQIMQQHDQTGCSIIDAVRLILQRHRANNNNNNSSSSSTILEQHEELALNDLLSVIDALAEIRDKYKRYSSRINNNNNNNNRNKHMDRSTLLRTLMSVLVNKLEYHQYLIRNDPVHASDRWSIVEELIASTSKYDQMIKMDSSNNNDDALSLFLRAFNEETSNSNKAVAKKGSSSANKEGDDDNDAVIIATLHSSKGLEWPVVFIPGIEQNIIPHIRAQERDQIQEERRLLFVGITRAREQLYLLWCRLRPFNSGGGELRPTTQSEFLESLIRKCGPNSSNPESKGNILVDLLPKDEAAQFEEDYSYDPYDVHEEVEGTVASTSRKEQRESKKNKKKKKVAASTTTRRAVSSSSHEEEEEEEDDDDDSDTDSNNDSSAHPRQRSTQPITTSAATRKRTTPASSEKSKTKTTATTATTTRVVDAEEASIIKKVVTKFVPPRRKLKSTSDSDNGSSRENSQHEDSFSLSPVTTPTITTTTTTVSFGSAKHFFMEAVQTGSMNLMNTCLEQENRISDSQMSTNSDYYFGGGCGGCSNASNCAPTLIMSTNAMDTTIEFDAAPPPSPRAPHPPQPLLDIDGAPLEPLEFTVRFSSASSVFLSTTTMTTTTTIEENNVTTNAAAANSTPTRTPISNHNNNVNKAGTATTPTSTSTLPLTPSISPISYLVNNNNNNYSSSSTESSTIATTATTTDHDDTAITLFDDLEYLFSDDANTANTNANTSSSTNNKAASSHTTTDPAPSSSSSRKKRTPSPSPLRSSSSSSSSSSPSPPSSPLQQQQQQRKHKKKRISATTTTTITTKTNNKKKDFFTSTTKGKKCATTTTTTTRTTQDDEEALFFDPSLHL